MIETLQVFGMNIWQWCVDNKEAIIAFFMSGQFVSLIAAIVMLVRNIKQVKNNTASTQALDKTLVNTNVTYDKIIELDENVKLLTAENIGLREKLAETENNITNTNKLLSDKLNAIIEVQSIVYSTIRDDSVRQTVTTILNNARYSEKNFKEQLEMQIEELKTEFETKVADMNKAMNDTISNVANSINAAETAKIRAQKIKGIEENTRY